MIAPDLGAALSLYESALAKLAAPGESPTAGREEEYERTVGGFESRVADIRVQLCATAEKAAAEAPFDEARRSHLVFEFDASRHNLLGTIRSVLELEGDADLSRLHERLHTHRARHRSAHRCCGHWHWCASASCPLRGARSLDGRRSTFGAFGALRSTRSGSSAFEHS